MPVTAKLSRHFYEKLGDEATNELVNWFNSVDLDYRTALTTLNESNFARFDAKVEQRFAEHDAKWERRIADLEVRWERRLAEQDVTWERRFSHLDAKIEVLSADLKAAMGVQESRLVRWMWGFWTTTLATQAGLFYVMLRK
jgi:hypothetical protein